MRTKNKDKELNHRHFIGLRLTDVELDLLDQGAACLSVSRSEYLRKLLLEKQIHHQIEVVADTVSYTHLIKDFTPFYTVLHPQSEVLIRPNPDVSRNRIFSCLQNSILD